MRHAELIEHELSSRCGYVRVKFTGSELYNIYDPSVFRATWSCGDVQHFIYLGSDVSVHRYFIGKFGMRSSIVEKFSIDSLIKFGHQNYGLEKRDHNIYCMMAFGFERFDLSEKKIKPRIVIRQTALESLAELIARVIEDKIFPVIKSITTLESFMNLLVADVEPCRWFVVNPLARAAQIVALGCQLGVERADLRKFMAPKDRLITKELALASANPKAYIGDPKSCVDWYVDQLIADWLRRSA